LSADQPLWLTAPVAFLLGAVAGSFLATILVRWPKGQSVLRGRSRCDSCGDALAPSQLTPLLSFLAFKGKCRRCGAPIDPRHFAIELAGAMLALVAALAHPLPLAMITALLGWWLLLVAALDLEHHWLPDRLTLPLIALGLALGWLEFGPALQDRLIGAAAGFASLALIGLAYRHFRGRQGLGGGDPKLFAAIGAWLGWLHLPYVLLGAGLLGLAAASLMALRGAQVQATTRLPLGSLLAVTAWPVWLVIA
jgi:leader peptidase (prepilin peptidase) / N-methyltransferase